MLEAQGLGVSLLQAVCIGGEQEAGLAGSSDSPNSPACILTASPCEVQGYERHALAAVWDGHTTAERGNCSLALSGQAGTRISSLGDQWDGGRRCVCKARSITHDMHI